MIHENINTLLYDIDKRVLDNIYLWPSIILLLLVVYVLMKTYRATKNVEKRLLEFASKGDHPFSEQMLLVEVHANEHKLNKKALGPLARIIDEYVVIIMDTMGSITYVNEKFVKLKKMGDKNILGEKLFGAGAEVYPEKHPQEFWKNISDQKIWHGEYGIRSYQGDIFWLDLFVFPLSLISNDEQGFFCFGSDITNIKNANLQLRDEVNQKDLAISKVENMLLHSEKMASLGTISAGIAHEINNPVAFISSNLVHIGKCLDEFAAVLKEVVGSEDLSGSVEGQLVHSSSGIDKKYISYLIKDYPFLMEETNEGVERIKKIIHDLKTFSYQNTESCNVNVHECIETALNLVSSELKEKVTVKKSYGQNIPSILGSETQLSQVFVNMFINAVHAIGDNGVIDISTRKDSVFMEIIISDNGSGIDPGKIKNIFDPFFTTKPAGQGTGLGLSISHDIIKRHGGEINVESELGVGTAFHIKLPLHTVDNNYAVAAA